MNMSVRVENLSVSFLGKEVLHGVNAFFAPQTLSVLIGRSGSGKTTLLRSINRLNEEFEGCHTSGQIVLSTPEKNYPIYAPTSRRHKGNLEGKGESFSHNGVRNEWPMEASALALNELRVRVGMVFQTPNVFPVSVYQNIAMPLNLVGGCSKRDAEEKVYAALKLVGLWDEVKDTLQKSAERLSGGQQQRLCLARVLALRPQVLLLDEPTASLDVHSGRHIEEVLLELARDYTVIMVSHGLSQARRLANKIMICKEGRITHALDSGSEISEEMLEEVV